MKYLVNFFYNLNENTTFKYDAGCKTFMRVIDTTGAIVATSDADLELLKTALIELLDKFSTKYDLPAILPSSFDVKVFELRGVNDECNAIVPGKYDDLSNINVYTGKLTDLTNPVK